MLVLSLYRFSSFLVITCNWLTYGIKRSSQVVLLRTGILELKGWECEERTAISEECRRMFAHSSLLYLPPPIMVVWPDKSRDLSSWCLPSNRSWESAGFPLCLSLEGMFKKKKQKQRINQKFSGGYWVNTGSPLPAYTPSHPNPNRKKVKTRCTAEWLYSSQSVGGARAPRSWGAVGGLAAVLSCLVRLGGRRVPSIRPAPPLGAPPFAPLPCAAPSGPRWSLARVQCVLELGAGVTDMKTFLVDRVVGVELDHNGVTGWVDLLRRLWGGTETRESLMAVAFSLFDCLSAQT